ncbi:MAG: hypothetical protein QOG15_239 [Solirubrobacteraceae bacterium]|jgi:hypothetical protein|nr:hypothetical protein [Solirubrobacteraceae bacterium]
MRSRVGYWLGGGLIAAGAAAAILWFVLSFVAMSHTIDEFARVPAGTARTLHLDAHKYVIYSEGPNAEQFPRYLNPTITDLEGRRVLTPVYASSLTYSMSGHEGNAQATVTPPRAGTYRITVPPSTGGPGDNVALGESIAGRIVRSILGAFAVGGLIGLSGIALLVTTIVRRYNARQKPAVAPSPFGRPPSG